MVKSFLAGATRNAGRYCSGTTAHGCARTVARRASNGFVVHLETFLRAHTLLASAPARDFAGVFVVFADPDRSAAIGNTFVHAQDMPIPFGGIAVLRHGIAVQHGKIVMLRCRIAVQNDGIAVLRHGIAVQRHGIANGQYAFAAPTIGIVAFCLQTKSANTMPM